MNKLRYSVLRAGLLLALMATALAVDVGEPAPDFTAIDSNGRSQRLFNYRGKYVVLEWYGRECSYTKKHYDSGNMQRLQKDWTGKGVVWLTIISSPPGSRGYATPTQENDYLKQVSAAPTAVLMDPGGTLGRLYSARTMPQMFVIDPKGTLIYEGAIDDHATSNPADIAKSKNYVSAALEEALAGKAVTDSATEPYGCTIKYKRR